MFGFKQKRREKLKEQPFPPPWLAIIERNLPFFKKLPPEDQAELQGHVQVFLAEKKFEGLGGLEMTDEIRVTIAAQACILLLHRQTDYYPDLLSILVYPHHYFAPSIVRNPDGTVTEGVDARLGESWQRGEVVLSWNDVLSGAQDPHDGHNVVFHEFAHQLDAEADGRTDGAPALPRRSMYISWARVLSTEYQQLLQDLEQHRRNCIDSYGATNPAEFFAVVTELFFEQGRQLKQCHPELYEQLRLFYQQDPAGLEG
ncbi:MAG: zinc-dependent peptidase [Candidatus Alcyoniella australis]|nr:zinc-dependent peptidase [Candidatus Alcyoniella australis]